MTTEERRGAIMSRKRCAVGLVWVLAAALVSHAHAEEAAPNQPQTYYVIPIKGVIGRHFTAARMQACLKEAERLKPTLVVIELDTGGGDIYDAERIVDLIIAHKDLRFVAFVNKALSAGAPITLACEKIFVTESATIGGAVSYSVGSDGMPQTLPADVAEKFQSVWRAVCRKAAEHGGHLSLLAEAMVDPAFALTMREEQGKPVFERDGQGKVLKAKGQILTLTAREAVECTLAEELVPDLKAVGRYLGMPDWQEVGGRQGVQPAEAGSPEKSASAAVAADMRLFESIPMVFQRLPHNLYPDRKEGWNNLQQQLVQDWLTKNIEQHSRLFVTGEYGGSYGGMGVYAGHEGIRVSLHYSTMAILGVPYPVTCHAVFEPVAMEQLIKLKDGDRVRLTGTIHSVEIHHDEHRRQKHGQLIHFFLVNCVMGHQRPRPEPRASDSNNTSSHKTRPAAEDEPARKCSAWLSMARNYIRAGMPEKAIPYLKQVIEQYGDTEYAKEARELGQEALQMIKTRSGQEDTPPTEGEPAPAPESEGK